MTKTQIKRAGKAALEVVAWPLLVPVIVFFIMGLAVIELWEDYRNKAKPDEPLHSSEMPRPSESSYTVEQKRAILLHAMAVRKEWAQRVAFERYSYTGPISTEQDAALCRDLSPTEAARLFPVHERQTDHG